MKYVLLHMPWVIISATSWAYYHLGKTEQLRYLANLSNVVSFLSLFILVSLLSNKRNTYKMPLKVMAQHMTLFIVFPKVAEHIFSYIKITTGNPHLFSAYEFSIVPYICMGLYLLTTSIRILLIKRKERYG